nr:Cardiolipin synthase [Hymenolepis microstoma]
MNVRNFSRLSSRACKIDFILRPGKYTYGFNCTFNGRWSSSRPQHKIITIPNILTSLRIAATPVIVSLILQSDLTSAAVLTVAAGLTDVADGYIARSFPNQRSVAGSYLDPLADKLFVSLLAISLAYTDLLPSKLIIFRVTTFLASLLILFLSRDVLILIGASYVRYLSLQQPRSLLSLVAPKERVIEMKPINSSKLNTAVQITTVVSSLLAPVFGLQNNFILPVLWLSAGLTTLYSGFGYARIFPSVLKEAQQVSTSKSKK